MRKTLSLIVAIVMLSASGVMAKKAQPEDYGSITGVSIVVGRLN